jgi:hypothetical protein
VPPSLKQGSAPVVKAYIEGWRVADEATSAPNKDWSTALSRYIGEPFKSEFIQTLEDYAKTGTHTTGHVSVSATLLSRTDSAASVRGCIDTSHQDILDGSGHSVVVADGPGAYWRYVEVAHMKLLGGRWLLTDVDSRRDQKC